MEKTERQAAPLCAALPYLSGETASFRPSRGGMLSLCLTHPDGRQEEFDRVIVKRCFPLTLPDEFLSVREPTGDEREIGIIRRISDMDEESERLIRRELSMRYYVPKVTKIHSLTRRRAVFIDMETDLGRRRITLRDAVSSIRPMEDGRVFLTDADGGTYEIPNPRALDRQSYRRIEVFL